MRLTGGALSGLLFAASFSVGCGGSSALPDTVPLEGKVVFAKGGPVKVLADRQGIVELESVEQPDLHAYGAIAEDGSFSVVTAKGDAGSEGAIAGTHRVRLKLDSTAEPFVAPKFLSFEKSGITVKVPSEQPVEIKVWR